MADFDDFVDDLQHQINEQAKSAYGEEAFDRWCKTPHQGKPPATNCHGTSTGKCGDTIEIFLHIENDEVRDAGFLTNGCASSIMSGSMAAELALLKRCDDLISVTGELIRDNLGGLLKDDEHCAWLAANALHDAVGDYFKRSIHQTKGTGDNIPPTETP
jgi:nitrogen fixation NifU-like protein